MRIATWNVNGIRARFEDVKRWTARCRPDVFCLQELKASPQPVPEPLTGLVDYHSHWHGQQGGYSGVSLHLARNSFGSRPKWFSPPFDMETRITCCEVDNVVFASIYVPNGGKSYPDKVKFVRGLIDFSGEQQKAGKQLLLCGDLNVTRDKIDVHPTQRKPQTIGQTREERELFAELLATGLVDVGRAAAPDDADIFTWWPPWRDEKRKNHGWRIDYLLATAALAAKSQRCEVLVDEGTSDHAPVMADFESLLS